MIPRSILITGCSSGIGLDAARTLRGRGWRVLATCRQEADCARLRAEGLESFRLDHADPDSVAEGAAEALARTGGTLGALFNNGAFALPAPVEDVGREAMREIFETNLLGPHDLTRRLLPAMRAQEGGGRVINCSSVLGFQALRWRGAYVATKFAMEGLTDALRMELKDRRAPGARVHAVLIEPGPIATDIRRKARARVARLIDVGASDWRAAWEELILPRLNAPDDAPGDAFELPPAAVTRALIRALEARRPRARYRVTVPTHAAAALRRLLPDAALDRFYRDM